MIFLPLVSINQIRIEFIIDSSHEIQNNLTDARMPCLLFQRLSLTAQRFIALKALTEAVLLTSEIFNNAGLVLIREICSLK